MILGDRLDVIGSRFFLRLRLAKRERTTTAFGTLKINRRASPASQPIVMAQTSPLPAHPDVAQFPTPPPTLIGTEMDPGTAAPIDTETACPHRFGPQVLPSRPPNVSDDLFGGRLCRPGFLSHLRSSIGYDEP